MLSAMRVPLLDLSEHTDAAKPFGRDRHRLGEPRLSSGPT